jgi:hypothetical protein
MTGSMIAGAALLVAACGGSEDAAVNNAEMNVEDTLMTNDVTDIDAMNGTDANLGVDANVAVDTTTTNTTDTTTTTNTTDTNGM